MKINLKRVLLYLFSIYLFAFFFLNLKPVYSYDDLNKYFPQNVNLYLNLNLSKENIEILDRNKILYDIKFLPHIQNLIQNIKENIGINIEPLLSKKLENLSLGGYIYQINNPILLVGEFEDLNNIDIKNIFLENFNQNIYKGINYYQITKNYNNYYVTILNNTFIFSNNFNFLSQYLDNFIKKQDSLSNSSDIKKIYAKIGSNKILFLYLNMEQVNNIDISKLGIGVELNNYGIEVKTNSIFKKVKINQTSKFSLPTKLTPPEPYFFYATTSEIWNITNIPEFKREWNVLKQEIYIKTGIDIDLLRIILSESEEFGINCYKANVVDKNLPTFPNLTLFFKVKNKTYVDRILRQVKIKPLYYDDYYKKNSFIKFGDWLKYRERTITVMNRIYITENMNLRPAYTFLDNYLILGVYPGCVMRAIDIKDNLLPSLSLESNFTDTILRLSNNNLVNLGYSDGQAVLSLITSLSKNNLEISRFIPYFETIRKIGFNIKRENSNTLSTNLLIDLNWDKVDINYLLGN